MNHDNSHISGLQLLMVILRRCSSSYRLRSIQKEMLPFLSLEAERTDVEIFNK